MSVADTKAGELKTTAEVERDPAGVVKRWIAEIALADRAEEKWRDEAKDLWGMYESEQQQAYSFNILWANTDTLAPALYNSTPEPDVRRRFRDRDPIGKAVSTILERSLEYHADEYDLDSTVHDVVLDLLVPGRGVARIKYEPKFAAIESPEQRAASGSPEGEVQPEAEAYDSALQAPAASPSGAGEKLVDESVQCEHVQWDAFRHGPGKRWEDVPWVAFRHLFTYEMAVDKFGEDIAKLLSYEGEVDDKDRRVSKEVAPMFKQALVWEVWDKDQRRVLFIAPSLKGQPCLVVPDPLQLKGFFPMPRPVVAIRRTTSLVPIPLFRQYKQQALELNRISTRINKIIAQIKSGGAYAAHLEDMPKILNADDGELVPITNGAAVAQMGGLDKAIWLRPTDKAAQTLQQLYIARDQIKATIYEITGISDIVRGATDASETATAQRIKSQWSSLRLQKMQREVQRFVRDLMRLRAEVIAERFSPETLATITNVQLPHAQEKEAAQMALQQAQQQAQMTGQPPDPAMLQQAQDVLAQPSWDEVIQVLRSDVLRTCRVDIETDSTVAESIERDMSGLSEVLDAIGKLLAGAAPAVQAGMVTVDQIKETAKTIIRRARLGSALEDAFDQMQPPAPPMPAAPPVDPQQITQGVVEAVGQQGEQLAKGLEQRDQANAQALEQLAQQLMDRLEAIAAESKRPKRVRFEKGADGRIAAASVQ